MNGTNESAIRSIRTLFNVGAIGGLPDSRLLELFIARREGVADAAFEALVDRHGPMVFDVCRNVVGNRHDAEDAAQATFLILARKAATINHRQALPSWLFGVARRVATQARCDAAHRRAREREAAAPSPAASESREAPTDLPALYEEIDRLPARYRDPLILCYLNGMTYEAAARHLGWPPGTLSVRLMRARETLKARLIRRGIAGPACLLSFMDPVSATSRLSPALSTSTVAAAMGRTPRIAAISSRIVSLMNQEIGTMLLTELKIAATALLILSGGAGFVAYQAPTTQGDPPPADKTASPVAPARSIPPRAPLDPEARSRLIEEKLASPITPKLPDRTTLNSILKSLREASKGPDDAGVPIHVDPAGLRDAGIGINQPLDINFPTEGRPMSEILRKLLRPLELDYDINDGLLLISSRDLIVDQKIRRLTRELTKLKESLEPPR